LDSSGSALSIARLIYVLFLQADDGIRDRNVTGVQTCALPISDPQVQVFHPAAGQLVADAAGLPLPDGPRLTPGHCRQGGGAAGPEAAGPPPPPQRSGRSPPAPAGTGSG